jgi:hypothetical protein
MTRIQWLILIDLILGVICLYFVVIPVMVWFVSESSVAAESPADLPAETILAMDAPTDLPIPTRTRTRTPSPTFTPTIIPPTATSVPTLVPVPTPLAKPVVTKIAPDVFANLATNPRARLVSKTTLFTTACYGENVNPLQDRDYMTPSDWGGSLDTKCLFGYAVNPADRLPTGRYSAGGGPDGQPRFYIIPGGAFKDQQNIKMLSHLHIIVDPAQGCDALGSIGVNADGASYQCSACAFLRAGGVCPAGDGSKELTLPINPNNLLNPESNGGAYGFLGFPAAIFRKDFSLYFTGRGGYPPPRIYFEAAVDTLFPNVNVETTAEMTGNEIKTLAAEFDRLLAGKPPIVQIVPFERAAQPISESQATLQSKQEAVFAFATTPGSVLSSIVWRISPKSNVDKRQFLEANGCLTMNGEEVCFTGVEDFAHCAFYTPCVTGYSSLNPIAGGGYIATRYFPAGTAPLLSDGRTSFRVRAPDIGSVLEVEVEMRVRDVDANLFR